MCSSRHDRPVPTFGRLHNINIMHLSIWESFNRHAENTLSICRVSCLVVLVEMWNSFCPTGRLPGSPASPVFGVLANIAQFK